MTKDCELVFVKSGHTSGYYVKVVHGRVTVVLLGLNGLVEPAQVPANYKVEMAKDAIVSFNVFKRTSGR